MDTTTLIIYVCTMAKSSTACFYWGFFLQPVWHPQVLGWSHLAWTSKQSVHNWLVTLSMDLATHFWYVRICGAWNSLYWSQMAILLVIVVTWPWRICWYVCLRLEGHRPKAEGIHIRQITNGHVTSIMYHFVPIVTTPVVWIPQVNVTLVHKVISTNC